MKKIGLFLLACFAIFVLAISTSVVALADSAVSSNTVYLSNSGNDTNDGATSATAVKTIAKAYALLGEAGGEIVIVGTFSQRTDFTAPAHTGKVIIKGADANAKFEIARSARYYLGGETEITDLHISAVGNYTWYVICNFNSLKITETVSVTRNGSFVLNLGVQSGDAKYTPKNATLSVEGGDWSEIVAVHRNHFKTAHDPALLDDVDLTINIDKNAIIDRVFAFSRSAPDAFDILTGHNMRVNLLGGKINHLLCQTDTYDYVRGAANGMVVYIGKNFDITQSFTAGAQDDKHYVQDGSTGRYVFYGISPECSYDDNTWVSPRVKASGVIICKELYDILKDSTRIRKDAFAYIIREGEPIPTPRIPVALGTDGNIQWNLYADGELVISGTGSMNDFSSGSIPWYDYISNITSVTIEEGVTSIGSYAFYNCTSITSVTIPDSVTSIGDSTFGKCTSLTSINFSGGVRTIGAKAFSDCKMLKSIIIPEGVKAIGNELFYSCTGLESVSIPSTLNIISSKTFYNCSGLKTVSIAQGIITIDDYAFYNCKSITDLDIPSSVKTIGAGAFRGLSAITEISIPAGVSSIEDNAFRDCGLLAILYLPPSITNIGNGAFQSDNNLTNIVYCGTPEQWSSINKGINNAILSSATMSYHAIKTFEGKAPTCKEEGWKEYTVCTVCGYSTYEKLGLADHAWVDWTELIAPTCTNIGIETRQCTICGHDEHDIIMPTGHTMTFYEAAAPTCTNVGWNEYEACTKCALTTYVEIPALGHEWSEWTEVITPTCTKIGLEARNCAVCYEQDLNILQPRHNEITHEAKAPNCTEVGWDEYTTCGECGYSTYTEIPSLGGHEWGLWKILIQPTAERDGFKSRQCVACDETENEYAAYASGDIDGDGTLTNSDMTVAVRALAGFDTANTTCMDVNYDGILNNRDIIALIQKLAWGE